MSDAARLRRAGTPATILVLTLVGYPVAASAAMLTGLPNRALSIGVRGLLLALALDVLLRRFVARGQVPISPFWLVWWGFWTLYIVRMLLDGVLAPGTLRLNFGEYLVWGVGQCLVPASAQAGGTDDRGLRRALWATIALGAGAVVATLWFMLQSGAALSLLVLASGRAGTDTLNPISLGHLGATVAILSLWALTTGEAYGVARRVMLVAAGGVGVIALLLASSRGPILAFLAALALLATSLRGAAGNGGFRRAATLALPIAGLAGAFAWVWQNRELLFAFQRVSSGLFEDSARRELLASAVTLIARNPFTGGGTDPLDSYPHNVIVEAYLATGLVGGTLLVVLLAMALRAALAVRRARPAWGWTTLLVVQYVVAAMFSGSLYASAAMWVLLAVAASQRELLGEPLANAATVGPPPLRAPAPRPAP